MKDVIKKVLKEEQVNLFGDTESYELCGHFTDSDENELCQKLNRLRGWLHSDSGLGLKNIINSKLATIRKMGDVNDQYQEPLRILHSTNKYPEIKEEGGKYYLDRLKNVGLVHDDEGNWHHVNKLNTNYNDLAELLTELLRRGKMAKKLNTKNEIGLRKYLLSIKDKLSKVLDKYIGLDEYKEFIRNTRNTTDRGEKAEDYVKGIMEKFGMKTLYQGGNGDFIDMIFGADLIMSYNNKVYTVQVKNTESQLESARGSYKYNKVDYFSSPTNVGIVVYNKKGDNFIIDRNGELVK